MTHVLVNTYLLGSVTASTYIMGSIRYPFKLAISDWLTLTPKAAVFLCMYGIMALFDACSLTFKKVISESVLLQQFLHRSLCLPINRN